MSPDMNIVRSQKLADKIVIVDGQPGCGKTMLSPIVAALDRVELLMFVYEIEYFCALRYLQKMDKDTAETLIKLITDLRIYNAMMSREVNFRFSDASSAFKDINPLKYIRRLFQKGDDLVPERIKNQRPILHLATHDLLSRADSVFAALGENLVFIEVVRHPLYMLKQEAVNMQRLFLSDPKHFEVYFSYKDKELPYFVYGWEDLFFSSNHIEKAIYLINSMTERTEAFKNNVEEKLNGAKLITIPFEGFVISPEPYLKEIELALDTKVTKATRKMMKRQNVPRKMYAQGVKLDVYEKYGWEAPKSTDEYSELNLRRKFAQDNASEDAMVVLDRLSKKYEDEYLNKK
ncbi:MAG: hypothetical protein K9L86_02870 [Candidatus Omnitrophica bacterium]|nr:hypothetical protein [Candidatus Omnitrophota bacterium]